IASTSLRALDPFASVMAGNAIERCLPLRVTFHAEAHVDFLDRGYAIHRLNRTMAGLALQARMDVAPMSELYEIGQSVDSVPSDLDGGLAVIGPRARDRLDTAGDAATVASDAFCHRRYASVVRAPCVFVAVLAGNLVDARVHSMAEGDGLNHVGARQPRTPRQCDRCQAAE